MVDETRIVFTGDFSFSAYFQKEYKNKNLIEPKILEFVNNSDAIVINYESPITPCKVTKKEILAYRTDPEALEFIKNNFKKPILSFANNHIFDYGKIGVIDSLEYTEKSGIPFIGAGRNKEEALKFEIIGEDVKVAIISIQYKEFPVSLTNFCGPLDDRMIKDLSKKIKEIKPKVDWVVLVYHGGLEFLNSPTPTVRRKIKKFLKLGFDVVVAHHPHVVQGYEYFDEKPVFYSLGNFVFDTDYQRIQEGTDKGLLLKLMFSKNEVKFNELPITINRDKKEIEVGSPNPYFINYEKKGYKKVFTYEAMEYEKIKEKRKKILQIEREKNGIVPESKEESKNFILEIIIKIYKIIFKNKEKKSNYISLTIAKIRYKLFYRKKGGL